MRRRLAFLLLFSLAGQHLLWLGVVLHYRWQKEQITAAFCVNRDRPDLHCEGRCYLQKQLGQLDCCQTEQQEHASSRPVQKILKPELPVYLLPLLAYWRLSGGLETGRRGFHDRPASPGQSFIPAVFQPPRAGDLLSPMFSICSFTPTTP